MMRQVGQKGQMVRREKNIQRGSDVSQYSDRSEELVRSKMLSEYEGQMSQGMVYIECLRNNQFILLGFGQTKFVSRVCGWEFFCKFIDQSAIPEYSVVATVTL